MVVLFCIFKSPSSAEMRPANSFKKVDFPSPFLPMSQILSPLWMVALISSRITFSANLKEIFSKVISGIS